MSRESDEPLHIQPGAGRDGILGEQVEGGEELLLDVCRNFAKVPLHPLVDKDLIPRRQRSQLPDLRRAWTRALNSFRGMPSKLSSLR